MMMSSVKEKDEGRPIKITLRALKKGDRDPLPVIVDSNPQVGCMTTPEQVVENLELLASIVVAAEVARDMLLMEGDAKFGAERMAELLPDEEDE